MEALAHPSPAPGPPAAKGKGKGKGKQRATDPTPPVLPDPAERSEETPLHAQPTIPEQPPVQGIRQTDPPIGLPERRASSSRPRARIVTPLNDSARAGEPYEDRLARLATERNAARWQEAHGYVPDATGWGVEEYAPGDAALFWGPDVAPPRELDERNV